LVHESANSGYSRNANVYNSGRPTYHPDLARRVVDRYGGGVVVELGAGTGIFTRQIVDLGASVIAIEPVVSMRSALVEAVPEADVRLGAAEDIPLGDHSADTIVASQSFHWFNYRDALDEIHRVIKPGGHLVTVWNVRDESVDWVASYTKIVDTYVGDTPRHRNMGWRRAINSDARFGSVDEWRIDNPYPTTPDGVIKRALSTSFIGAQPDSVQDDVAGEIRALVEPLGEQFDYPYTSQLQAWRALTDAE
jgi:ubiquinone/menaquinone biosynthesis C-methylase UbiE